MAEKEEKELKKTIIPDIEAAKKFVSEWDSKTKQQKRKYIINTAIIFLLSIGCIFYIIYEAQFADLINQWADKVSNQFFKGLIRNIIPFNGTVVVIFLTIVLTRILSIVFNVITPKTQKAKTAMTLIRSVIKYLLFIIAFFVVLGVWGVDTAAIVASAGAMTVILGICVKTIADDLVAGVFLVFEGNVDVGDIITYGGFKGTIREIGLRITKIENINNDVQIIRNSALSVMINHTKNESHVTIKIAIPNKVAKATAIENFKKMLPEIAKGNKDIDGEMILDGIIDFNASNTTYQISYMVKEKRAFQTQRYIYDKLKDEFDRLGYYN